MKKTFSAITALSLSFLLSGCIAFGIFGNTPKTYQETQYVETQDGWKLALHRYYQKGNVKYKTPVILCHGVGYNADFWDIEKKRSFAQYLAGQGYDVWSVSLRGVGNSTKSGWNLWRDIFSFRPSDINNVSMEPKTLNWNIDDHINKDLPAIIKKVKEVTGAKKVDWVGHSMGSMIVLAYLEKPENAEQIGNVVVIAPSCVHLKPQNAALDFIEKRKFILEVGLLINQRTLYKALVPFQGGVKDPLADLFYSSENMDSKTITILYNDVVENISPGVMDQLILMLKEENFMSADGQINYSENLVNITNPILFIAGRDDNLATPETVRYGYRKVSSPDKKYLEFSKIEGTKQDYGHNDLIIGKRAPEEVYPKIYGWLSQRSKPIK